MKITLRLIGKTADKYLEEGISIYQKRLSHYADFRIDVVPDIKGAKNMDKPTLIEKEGKAFLDRMDKPAVDKVEELHKSGVTGYGMLVPEKIAFARGNIQFWYNDLEKAETNLSRAVRNDGALDLHSGSTAWFRLGQTYDLRIRRPEAISSRGGSWC